MANVLLVIGLGYGDEGKGGIIDYLTRKHEASLIVRFGGGAQAAHNVVLADGRHHTFAQMGSGTFAGARTHLSKHMLVNPVFLRDETRHLRDLGIDNPYSLLTVHKEALITNPFQVAANRLREMHRSGGRHGSCGMGIGETVADFVALGDGLRAGDLTDPDIIQDKLKISQEFKRMQIRPLLEGLPWTEDLDREWDILNRSFGLLVDFYLDFAKRVTLVGDEFLEGALRSDKTIIFEGAQGVLLDQSFGWFPYVTRSTTTYANAIDLLKGHPATRLGLLRTYSTRHGAGPFVTEDASLGHYEAHNGWGQWQEKFRQGHFDFVAVDYALRAIGGVDGIVLTHLDRMQGPQKVCVAYDPAVDLTLPETILEQMRITEALGLTVPQYRMVDDLVQELGKLAPVVLTSHGPTAEDKHERKSHPRTAKDADRSSAWDEVRP